MNRSTTLILARPHASPHAGSRGNRSRKKPVWLAGRRGFGTLEVVIIISVLLTVALIFRHSLISFAQDLIDKVLHEDSVIEELSAAIRL